ncbi:SBE2.1, partial [Symbiodinium sp. KB8]
HEQEKKLKEYVNSNQVKDLIRLIQVFSVIKPATAVWIESEDCGIQESVSTDAMESTKYTRTEVAMIVMVLLLLIPYAWNVARRIHQEWSRLTMMGEARNGYFIHLDREENLEARNKPGHQNCACSECIREYAEIQWRKNYDKVLDVEGVQESAEEQPSKE